MLRLPSGGPSFRRGILLLLLTAALSGCDSPFSHSSPTPTVAACHHLTPPSGPLRLSGVAYGPYHTGQSPDTGIFPSDAEVQADMATLKAVTNSIRIYSSTGPADEIIRAAEANGMQVTVGISLGTVPAANEAEIGAGEQAAASSAVPAVIVGNEALTRGDLSEDQLRSYIRRVRGDIRAKYGERVRVTMADTASEWLAHPSLAQDVDFITVHIYPYWENVSIDCAIGGLDKEYQRVVAAFPHQQIVIGETGWPSAVSAQPEALPGSTRCSAPTGRAASPTPSPTSSGVPSAVGSPAATGAAPSPTNQALYLGDFVTWAAQHAVPYFYFDAFDEGWKIHEAGVGTHWGLYQQDGQLKPDLAPTVPAADPATVAQRRFVDVAVGGLEPGFDLGIDTSQHVYGWLSVQNGVFTLAYPANQQWGTMFITVCKPVPPAQRQNSLDLSAYRSLVFDLRATSGAPCVQVGIKDWRQPDDGSEQKVDECLTTQWATYTRPLGLFSGADLTRLYVVFEVNFSGPDGATIQVRNVRYSPSE